MPTNFEPIGFQLHLVILTIVSALLVAAVVVVAIKYRRTRSEDWGIGLIGAALVSLFGLVPLAISAIPYSPLYWQDYRVAGNVTSVSNTWGEDGGDMVRVPVVQLDTVDRPLVVDDPRVVNLEGRDIVFTCTIEWHFRAADRYACRIAEIGADR